MRKIRQYTRTIPADLETPVGIYLKIRDLYPQSALLESSDYHASQNAVSFIGVEPIGSFKVENEQVVMNYPDGETIRKNIAGGKTDVIDELRGYIESFEIEREDGKQLPNGLLGYTAYDAVRYFESVGISGRQQRFADVPDMYYVLYRYLIQDEL